ncbi:MAG: hypothetical protein ACKVKR_13975, partial [Pseudomonadales bacterium]
TSGTDEHSKADYQTIRGNFRALSPCLFCQGPPSSNTSDYVVAWTAQLVFTLVSTQACINRDEYAKMATQILLGGLDRMQC